MNSSSFLDLLKSNQLGVQSEIDNFEWPVFGEESWRYSTPKSFIDFVGVGTEISKGVITVFDQKEILKSLSDFDSVLFFINGDLVEAKCTHSSVNNLLNLGKNFGDKDWLQKRLKFRPSDELKALQARNYTRIKDVSVVAVPPNQYLKVALLNVYGTTIKNEKQGASIYPRTIIKVSNGAKLDLLDLHLGIESQSQSIHNHVTFDIEKNSTLGMAQVIQLSRNSIMTNSIDGDLSSDSTGQVFNRIVGSRHIRNQIQINLNEPGASFDLSQATSASEGDLVDTSSQVNHVKGFTNSNQKIKNLVSENGAVSFTGSLKIHFGAQKSDSQQFCHNLLVGDKAVSNIRPQLEVLADDVKAAHGATMGQLNQEEVFYLQSRGISRSESEKILAKGFFNDQYSGLESDWLRKKIMELKAIYEF